MNINLYKYNKYKIKNEILIGGHTNLNEIVVKQIITDKKIGDVVIDEFMIDNINYFLNNINIVYSPLQKTENNEINRIATFTGIRYILHNIGIINKLANNEKPKIVIDGMNVFRNKKILLYFLCLLQQIDVRANLDIINELSNVLSSQNTVRLDLMNNIVVIFSKLFNFVNTDVIITLQSATNITGTFERPTDVMAPKVIHRNETIHMDVYLLHVPCYFEYYNSDKTKIIKECHETRILPSKDSFKKISPIDSGKVILGFTNLNEITEPEIIAHRRSVSRSHSPIIQDIKPEAFGHETEVSAITRTTVKNESDDIVSSFLTYYFYKFNIDTKLWSYDNYDWMSDDLKNLPCFNNFGYIVLYESFIDNDVYPNINILFINNSDERINQDNIILLESSFESAPSGKPVVTRYINKMHSIGKNDYLVNLVNRERKKQEKINSDIAKYNNIINNFIIK